MSARASAAMARIDREVAQLRAEFARDAAKSLVEGQDNVSLRTEEIIKTQRRRALQRLTAPVDGTVQQLAVHTPGGVVQPAEQLMLIVPADGGIHVEAKVLNKDIGFVKEGQPVRIKVEAFPYTEHGIVEGMVAHIGRDSETDEALGLVYPVRVTIGTDGPAAALSRQLMPGMAVQAEVVTDRRRVIEYLLSPIERTVGTAGRER
ncbi:MAG: Leukotoxin export protein LtxD [Dehalococcoidia bacterium]|nr:Leukotoxin export protein LtxD [Chloroflexota bacterium]